MFWIVVAVLVAVAAYAVVIYNNLIKNRQLAEEGWSGIDVQLKRRADLVPNMLETVKGYMSHERETLQAVTDARAAVQAAGNAGPAARSKAEGLLSGALGRLFAVAENYPDLKANTNFLEFQDTLRKLEDEIQMARRYYNGTVRDLNVAIQSFPSNLVANAFHFGEREYFELDEPSDRAVPSVSFN